jgi:hypothetical protein
MVKGAMKKAIAAPESREATATIAGCRDAAYAAHAARARTSEM